MVGSNRDKIAKTKIAYKSGVLSNPSLKAQTGRVFITLKNWPVRPVGTRSPTLTLIDFKNGQ